MGGSGVQRPLKFLKYLPQFGWEPTVLCPDHAAYSYMDPSLEQEYDSLNLKVVRVKNETPLNSGLATFLTKRTEFVKTIFRKLSDWFYIPDNKKNWTIKAVEVGEKLIKDQKIDLIFSSGPPFSSHLAAIELAKRTNTKVVIDYRDAWSTSHFARYPTKWHKYKHKQLEAFVADKASAICAITKTVLDSVSLNSRNSQLKKVVPHGYDHDDFEKAMKLGVNEAFSDNSSIYFIHNGLFYNERRPDELLKAFALLKQKGEVPKLKLVLQGGLDTLQKKLISKMNLVGEVIDLGYQSHLQSIRNMMSCQATILLIGHKTRAEQIVTGKLYEYLGAKKPIIALVPEGEAKNLLVEYKAGYFGNPYDIEQIARSLKACYNQILSGESIDINHELVHDHTRKEQTEKLAMLFNETMNQIVA
jgi:glycosyltransferase involved in cell wall biosynthesis